MNSLGLTFGIYPLSIAGTPFGLAKGPEDIRSTILGNNLKVQVYQFQFQLE